MRKKVFSKLLIVCLVCLVACSKKAGNGKNKEEQRGNILAGVELKLTPTDANPGMVGGTSIAKTEKGYYFYSAEKGGICYADAVTGKQMYLCNKPECRHDGNEFCVATTDRYMYSGLSLYDGMLFATGIEETETQYLYKLLTIALDGSQINEVATYYTLEKGTRKPDPYLDWNDSRLFIHRNKIVLPIEITGQEGLEDTVYCGLGVFDLDTMEIAFVDEEAVAKENPESKGIGMYGDYVYFCRQEGKRLVLYRYHLTEGKKESLNLFSMFGGDYVVLDDDTVLYTKRSSATLCLYHHGTGVNEEKVRLMKTLRIEALDGSMLETSKEYKPADIVTDGTYIYLPESTVTIIYHVDPETGEKKAIAEANLIVLDRELNEVGRRNLADSIYGMEWEGVDGGLFSNTKFFSYVGDEVYTTFTPEKDMTDTYTFRCKMADLLAGTPRFELVYSDLFSRREKGISQK